MGIQFHNHCLYEKGQEPLKENKVITIAKSLVFLVASYSDGHLVILPFVLLPINSADT